MQFINSKRGSPKLCHLGYIYTKQHERVSGTRWVCEQRLSACKGAVRTNGLAVEPVILVEHNHLANPDRIAVAEARNTMKRVAETGVGKPAPIYSRVQRTLNADQRQLLPSAETCKRTIRRSLTSNEPPQPDALNRLVVEGGPIAWTQTVGPIPERFLLYDNGVNALRRIIIYATDGSLNALCASDNIFMDGTFKCCPQLFMQLYVIHGIVGQTTIPTVYAYLERKDREIYDELFTTIATKCRERDFYFTPVHIHIDFEDSVIRSIRGVLGMVPSIHCCFFHLCQSTWKHIQDLGLVETLPE